GGKAGVTDSESRDFLSDPTVTHSGLLDRKPTQRETSKPISAVTPMASRLNSAKQRENHDFERVRQRGKIDNSRATRATNVIAVCRPIDIWFFISQFNKGWYFRTIPIGDTCHPFWDRSTTTINVTLPLWPSC